MVPAQPEALQPALHPWALINPQQSANQLKRHALAQNVLAKIALVAITAICAAVLIASYVVGTATGTLPFLLVGLILVTPFLAIGASKWQSKSKELGMRAEEEQAVADHLQRISGWQDDEIRAFLVEKGVQAPPGVPLRALLPLIARFESLAQTAQTSKASSDRMLLAAGLEDRAHRLSSRLIGWQKFVGVAAPALLEAGMILQILSQPTLQVTLGTLGTIHQMNFDERQFNLLYGPNDNFFTFEQAGRVPILLRDIEQNFTAQAMRARLFPPAVQEGV